jgi:two-component system sensor histidine kinase KdpD
VSHDLRTPLVSVIGSLTAIRDMAGQLTAEDQGQLVTTALDEAERLNRLIQNLLDATRLAQGGMPLRLTAVAVDEVFQCAIQRMTTSAQSRIKVESQMGIPPARADRALLEQALTNLLENALKYSSANSPIYMKAREHKGRLLIEVIDNGPGIAASERTRVFDFFYRAQQGDSGVTGSGLGLAICKGFVESMGGTITTAAGDGGIGTVFTVELPIDENAPQLLITESP